MTSNEKQPDISQPGKNEDRTQTIEECLSVLINMVRDAAGKIEELVKNVDEIHEMVSYNHGNPEYSQDLDLMNDLDD